MEIVYFTLIAILLYLASDWILRRIESARGEILKNRQLIFFSILLGLALASFAVIRWLSGDQSTLPPQ